jgi:hypothetical protein
MAKTEAAPKRGRGRPTNAEVAARKAAEEKAAKKKAAATSKPSKKDTRKK